MRLIKQQNWDELQSEYASATFPSIEIERFLEEHSAKEIARSYPDFSDAKKFGKEFSKVNEKGKVQITDPDLFPAPVVQLSKELASEEFIANLEELSGISNLIWDDGYSGGGMHITRSEGHLDVHVDFNYSEALGMHRRLNLLLYLNEEWDQSWGGQLELWDSEVKNCFKRVAPLINRCVIFTTDDKSFHGVQPVKSPQEISRKSFAVYYYTVDPPEGWSGQKHSTVFKTRPDEGFKKFFLMPLESFMDSRIGKKLRSLKRVITR